MGRKLKKSAKKKTEKKHSDAETSVKEEPQKASFAERLQSAEDATDNQAPRCEVQVMPEVNDTEEEFEATRNLADKSPRCEVQVMPEVNDTEEEFEATRNLADKCRKNPGHKNFIPIKDIRFHHLPFGLMDPVNLESIRHWGNLTVKLTVFKTSKDRPKSFGLGAPRVGTGYAVHKPLSNIRTYRAGGLFQIRTAAHVVYDDEEAANTKVEFFFDDDFDKSGIISAKGVRVIEVHPKVDNCGFVCLVKDTTEIQRIRSVLDAGINCVIFQDHWTLNSAICVSHPHGLSKRVSFGSINSITLTSSLVQDYTHLLKLLIEKCTRLGISETSTVSVYYQIHGIDKVSSQLSPEDKKELFQHLFGLNLVGHFSQKDKQIVINELKTIITLWKSEIDKTYKLKHGKDNLSAGDKTLKTMEIMRNIMVQKASNTTVSDNFENYVTKIDTELFTQWNSLTTGSEQIPLGEIQSVNYSCPTCPGSSGANVIMNKWHGTGVIRFGGQHSRGLGRNKGNTCGGGYTACVM